MLGVFGKFALAGAAGGTGITGNVYAASSAGAEVRRAATRARNHPPQDAQHANQSTEHQDFLRNASKLRQNWSNFQHI